MTNTLNAKNNNKIKNISKYNKYTKYAYFSSLLCICFVMVYKHAYAQNINNNIKIKTAEIYTQKLDTTLSLNTLEPDVLNSTYKNNQNKIYGLFDIFELAKQNDAKFLGRITANKINNERVKQSKAQLLPKIDLQSSLNYAKNTRDDLSANPRLNNDSIYSSTTVNNQIILRQPLYRKDIALNIQQSKFDSQISNIKLLIAENDLLLQCAQHYFAALNNLEKIDLVLVKMRNLNMQLKIAEKQFKSGVGTINDIYETKTRLEQAYVNKITLENELNQHKLNLKKLLTKTPESINVSSNIKINQRTQSGLNLGLKKIKSINIEQMLSRLNNAASNAKNFQAQIADINVNIAKNNYDKAKALFLPTIELTAGVGYVQEKYTSTINSSAQSDKRKNASVGININIPLFAGFEHQSKMQEGYLLIEQANLDKQNIYQEMSLLIDELYNNIQGLGSQYKALGIAKESAVLALQANQISYKVGAKINMDVLNAQEQVFKIESDLKNMQYTMIQNYIKLQALSDIVQPAHLDFVSFVN
jgi:outer membrane protein